MALKLIVIYIAVLWIISAFLTVYDKTAAKQGWWRTPERTLLWLGFLGGAGIMFPIMKLIRHKTQKKKFMISLPLFMAVHLLLVALYCYLRFGR